MTSLDLLKFLSHKTISAGGLGEGKIPDIFSKETKMFKRNAVLLSKAGAGKCCHLSYDVTSLQLPYISVCNSVHLSEN